MAQLKRSYAMHGGEVRQYTHRSRETGTDMRFTVYLPPAAAIGPVPALYYLSGLTCTDDNFTQKAGAQRFASQQGIALIAPDTSPRGAGVAGEDDAYDFGSGAGWYVDATAAPWSRNYRMYSYVTKELPALAEDTLPLLRGVRSIMGHSMGGHGALTIAMREKGAYASVSAFAPICAPTKCPWGQKAFKGYFGDVGVGAAHDATELMLARGPFPELGTILVDQGTEDEFYSGATNQLRPADFEAACQKAGQGLELRYSAGGHDYFYIATLIDQHVAHHAKALRRRAAEQAAPAPPVAAPAAQPSTAGKPIKCRAAVAYAAKQPLKTVEITVAPPRRGEVRVKVICNALGHEAGTIVESVGEGVTTVAPGDHVVPCYTPQCNEPSCIFCMSSKTNLCPKIRATQGKGVMPDGTTRFTGPDGEPIYHFMGCSTFSEYTVLAEISCAKVNPMMPFQRACLFGCGLSTGLGAVWNTMKVETGATVAVFGLGAVGLAVIQAAKVAGARRIFAIDLNKKKFLMARALGATDCLCPSDFDKPMQQVLVGVTQWGVDYTFDCTGSVAVMRTALEAAHRGWGQSCVIGVAAAGKELATRPFQLVTGRRWAGTAFGGWKSRSDVPKLIERSLSGELPVDHYITHKFTGVDHINGAVDALHSGDCLRAVVTYFVDQKL
eukprot:TRINITY_DN751_c0_g1_i7.p1 TRINITY_DN751_c0_g1~~TRINITY_DN751_c0_g1_i7.p1  ORF type:complete len:703 (+),score=275.62 TRINITY_DN751_c0_g1_i7:109-2109(+)